MLRKIQSKVPRGAKRRAHCIIQIFLYMNYYNSIYAVIIKVFQSSIIVCASLRSAPALGKEYLPERRGYGNLGSHSLGRIVLLFLYSPFLRKKQNKNIQKTPIQGPARSEATRTLYNTNMFIYEIF